MPCGFPARVVAALAAIGPTLVGACERAADPDLAPELAPGDLVITEVRGAQAGADDSGQFIELYNASGVEVDLRGLALRLLRLDGSSQVRVLVRGSVPVAAGGYATLEPDLLEAQPAYVDYAAATDYDLDVRLPARSRWWRATSPSIA
ncbi:MAG: hypothetical protein R2939_03805 [Kofleriaceae bacterium]